MEDMSGHTNDGAAIVFGEVVSGTGGAVKVDCAEQGETYRGGLSDTKWFMGVRVRGAGVSTGVA